MKLLCAVGKQGFYCFIPLLSLPLSFLLNIVLRVAPSHQLPQDGVSHAPTKWLQSFHGLENLCYTPLRGEVATCHCVVSELKGSWTLWDAPTIFFLPLCHTFFSHFGTPIVSKSFENGLLGDENRGNQWSIMHIVKTHPGSECFLSINNSFPRELAQELSLLCNKPTWQKFEMLASNILTKYYYHSRSTLPYQKHCAWDAHTSVSSPFFAPGDLCCP